MLMKTLTTALDVLARSCAILLFIKFIMSVGNNVFGWHLHIPLLEYKYITLILIGLIFGLAIPSEMIKDKFKSESH